MSGRGVGMDAVQEFLRREQGRIELRFTDDRRGAAFRPFQMVICLPERLAVDSVHAAVGPAGAAHVAEDQEAS